MLAGSQHESKSHLISQGPNKLQMYTVKAKPSTNQHREEVNSLCTCRWEKKERDKTAVQKRTASKLNKGCAQTAGTIQQMYFTLIRHVRILIKSMCQRDLLDQLWTHVLKGLQRAVTSDISRPSWLTLQHQPAFIKTTFV